MARPLALSVITVSAAVVGLSAAAYYALTRRPAGAAEPTVAAAAAAAVGGVAKAPAARPRKHLIVGDIHGCLDELQQLLTKATGIRDFRDAKERAAAPIEWIPVHIGDLVAKGPKSVEVIQYVMDIGMAGVMGNHDHHIVMCADKLGILPPSTDADAVHSSVPPTHRGPPYPGIGTFRADSEHARIAAALTPAQLHHIHSLPLTLELPEYPDTILVHAGLRPPVRGGADDLKHQLPDHCLNMRNLGADGSVSAAANADADDGKAAAAGAGEAGPKLLPWAKVYAGPKQIVFGHDAVRGLQREPFALGLDTGCCYGKHLTAVILPDRTLVQVQAAKVYSKPNIPLNYQPLPDVGAPTAAGAPAGAAKPVAAL